MVVGIHRRRAIGVFPHHREATQALQELKNSGFPMDTVSLIAKDAEHQQNIAGIPVQEKVGDKADEGARVGAISGGTVGGLTGLLIGLGTLAIPGIGPVMLAGATATALATTLVGAGIGTVAGGLIGGLIGLGIPEERARVYHERVERGEYLIIIDGTDEEIAKGQAILQRQGIQEYGIYDYPNGKQTNPDLVSTPSAIGYFSQLEDVEAAINDLRTAGFPLSQINLSHQKQLPRNIGAGIQVSDRFESSWWRLADQRDRLYRKHWEQGDYIIIFNGTNQEIHQAADIVNRHGIKEWEIYEPSTNLQPNTANVAAPLQHQETPIPETVSSTRSGTPAVTIINRRDERV